MKNFATSREAIDHVHSLPWKKQKELFWTELTGEEDPQFIELVIVSEIPLALEVKKQMKPLVDKLKRARSFDLNYKPRLSVSNLCQFDDIWTNLKVGASKEVIKTIDTLIQLRIIQKAISDKAIKNDKFRKYGQGVMRLRQEDSLRSFARSIAGLK